jgi:hypothetical protein
MMTDFDRVHYSEQNQNSHADGESQPPGRGTHACVVGVRKCAARQTVQLV